MTELLLEPFSYGYMSRAIVMSALVASVCAFLSCYLVLRGLALMGDALAHAVVPGVAVAYLAGLPYALGAFVAGLAAAAGIFLVKRITALKEDAVIGVIFTSMFAAGLLLISINPVAVNLQSVIMGNILAIDDTDAIQVVAISAVVLAALGLRWKDLMLAFFDPAHARVVGLDPQRLMIFFFALMSAATVAALQTVGAVLVIAMLVTPGATAHLLTDRFGRMIPLAMAIGAFSGGFGAYLSYYLDGATGGVIVCLQTMLFLAAFVLAPKHGWMAARRAALQGQP